MRRKELVNRMALGAVLASAAISISSCGFQTVYGPPPEVDVTDEPIETVYGPPPDEDPVYDPSEDEIEDVYGPPVFEED